MSKRNCALTTMIGLTVVLNKAYDVAEFCAPLRDQVLLNKIEVIITACKDVQTYLRMKLESAP